MTLEARFRQALADHQAGRLAAAEAGYRSLITDAPDLAVAHHNLVALLRAQHRLEALTPAYEALLALEPTPELHLSLAVNLLRFGRYAEAWPHYEQRPSKAGSQPLGTVREWLGEDLDGRSLVVWDEQGFGDQIQMARYIPLLQARGARVEYACREPLRPLMEGLCPTLPRYAENRGRWDFWVSSMSLPARFGTTLETLPPPMPVKLGKTRSKDRGAGVGIVTQGGGRNPNDANRSLPPEAAARLMALPGAVSLQPEDTGAADFARTAEIIARLERVITVDTAVAHLAASLGKPTDVLVTALWPPWQWMLERRDSPWYPAVRLHRQARPGDWSTVIDEVVSGGRG
ncbi:MAG: hypothetical protein E7812_08295 [Phenylobacterium sp.]|nr:MAG: hypothetical protein E7812_08295 [Phenylobacterium sp.]